MSRIKHLTVALFLASSPALAAPPTGPDLARWLASNTDIPASQVAIAGPDLVYSLVPLGPPAPTGEVIALVRTEPLTAEWGAAHGFQSWEAHLLFDCAKGRMRQIRSATYPQRNRKGSPSAEEPVEGWTSPERNQPAEQLMSAACDASYAWPLRHNLLTGGPRIPNPPVVVAMPSIPKEAPGKLPVVVAATPPPPVAPAQPPAAATAKPGPVLAATNPAGPPTPAVAPAAAPAVAIGRFAVQLGRGPSEAGAKKMIADARTLLGASADMLAATTDISRTSRGRRRYTALLGGFPTLEAATNACDALTKAAQECLVRSADERVAAGPRPAAAAAPPPPAAAQASTVAKPAPAPTASAPKTTPALAAAAVTSQPSPPAPFGRFAVQLGRGPSKAGANRTIADARTLLGAPADKLSAATNMTEISRGRHRYTALLGGFPTLAAATEACDTLAKAGQECLTLDAGKPAVTAAAR